jgi:V/A-type H+/Na+-transporting ATPase subunit I
MLFTEPMKKIELLVMKSDTDAVMRYLGFSGSMQLISDQHEQRELTSEERDVADLKARLQALCRFLGMDEREPGDAGDTATRPADSSIAPDRTALRQRTLAVLDAMKPLIEEESRLIQRRLSLRQTADELSLFAAITTPFSSLQNLSYLTCRVGSVDADDLPELTKRLEKRALIMPLNKPGHFLAVAPKKGRFALDSELKRFDFQEGKLPEGMKGVPSDLLAAVNRDIPAVEESLRQLEARKENERASLARETRLLLFHLDIDSTIDTVKQTLSASGNVQKVTGWVPTRRFETISRGLDELTHGSMALTTFDPEEMAEVKSGKTKVPVSTPHGPLVRAFDRMVLSYSVPLYGTIDPTPFVAVTFVILFAIMFGDVGQGLVGVIIGLLINSGWISSFAKYKRKNFGTTFILAGAGSMISGFFYGSFFANERVLEPLTRAVTQLVIGRPLDHIISLGGFSTILLFFGVTIGIGAVINSIGLVINIVNMVRRGEWEKALLTKTGLAGALFFWYVLFIGVRILTGGSLVTLDFVAIAVPLMALFIREPLVRLIEHHHPVLKDGLFAFVMEGIVEILESTIYYVSNSVSFLRVAAFGLAHTVLSTIVFMLADMVGGGSGGIVFQILVILVGNGIIIVLEGLIVTIQVVRLQYYEFFSKFFNDAGEEFSPFILRTSGGLR